MGRPRYPYTMARLRTITARPEDIDGVLALSRRVFGGSGMTRWTRAQLEEHLRIFPEGQFVVYLDETLVASSSALLVPRDRALAPHTWMGITGGATLARHDPQGDCVYGIEIVIDREARGLGLAPMLYRARKVLARKLGLWGVAIGGRMAGYREAREADPTLQPEAYVAEVRAGKRQDPVLSVQLAAGFEPVRLLPGYIRDPASLDHSVLMIWETGRGGDPNHNGTKAPRVEDRADRSPPAGTLPLGQ